MTRTTNSKTRSTEKASAWLKPDPVERMRDAAYKTGVSYLHQRNELLVQFLYDTGLRVGEAVQIKVEYLRGDNQKLYLPGHVQKSYPIEGEEPHPATLRLTMDTPRLITAYLSGRERDSTYIFPSRQSPRMTTESVRNVIKKLAQAAEIRPYLVSGERGDPSSVTPHTLRHSVAWRMLNAEDGHTMYEVRNRFRHRSIQTTERIYDHIDEV